MTPPAGYLLGPGDQVSIFVPETDEINGKTFRIDTNGDLSLPLIGHLQASGLTLSQLEQACEAKLKGYMNAPHASVSLVTFGSQPVSVLGAVNAPGTHQLEGRKTLFEVLSSAGGLRTDASFEVKITRDLKWGRIPLPQTKIDSSGQSYVASVNLDDIINATDTSQNILIYPGDSISVPRADLIFVVGAVIKPGGIALAEGLQKTAAANHAKILRLVAGSSARTEIPIDLKHLMRGKNADIQLQANDILFVPNSGAKSIGYRTMDAVVSSAIGMAVYGHF